jgi:hypothetical protein
MTDALNELIEAADLNGLLRAVDGLCSARAWEDLLDLADRCEEAIERGKQLWPIAAHVDYRLALEAPGEYAARVLHPDVGRFSHGPLTEVVASSHRWEEIAPYIDTPQIAAYVAQERVLRGENLDGDEHAHAEVLELPLHLEPWEPTYTLATFRSDHVEVPEPWEPRTPMRPATPEPGRSLDEPELVEAWLDVVEPWTTESNGAAAAAVVEGDARAAAAVLGYGRIVIGALEPEEALQRIAWAAASGGAHGRRRGGAFGRLTAWYLGVQLTDLAWPPAPDELGREIARLRWHRWDEEMEEQGWILRLAVDDPEHGWAAAISATDLLESPEGGS